MTTTTIEKPVAVGTMTIDGVKYQAFYTDDPECPVLLKRINPIELGHKGRSWTGR